MDEQNSKRWLETIKREQRSKDKWASKFLTAEELQRSREEQEALAKAEAEKPAAPKRLSERDVMMQRLAKMESAPEEADQPGSRPMTGYEEARVRIAQQVAATRPRSHRVTQDLSTPALLRDIGPGLWISINPGYTHAKPSFFKSSQNSIHTYDPKQGWADRVDKTHHLKQDAFMAHADKCLQLGEKPFLSGGMKLSGK